MATGVPPKRATAFVCYVSLVSQADTKLLKSNPTLAAGDVKVSIDGGAFANLATLPTVTPAAGAGVKISLSASEMTGDDILVVFQDAAGAEWCDRAISIKTAARWIDDLAFPTVTGTGSVAQTGDNFARLGANGVGLSAIPDLAGVTTLLARLSAARAGYLDNVNNASLAGATFPTDPADQSLVIAATDAIVATIGALNNLSAAGVRTAVGLATANLDTQLDALPTTAELATALGTADDATLAAIAALPTVAALADGVWDEVLSGHLTAGTTGASLNAAGSAGDPWITALPGAYGAGSAGNIVGTNLDATVSSRLATAGYTAPLDAAGTRTAVGLASANLDTQLGDVPTSAELATALALADDAVLAAIAALNNVAAGAAMTLTAGERTAIADAALTRSLGTESYAADGAVPTLAQMQFMLLSALTQFGIIATTLTTRKLDGTTAAMTYTLDDATNPTSRVRAS